MARIGKFFFFDGSDNLATVFYHHVRSNGGVVESIGCVDNTPSFLEQSSFLLSPSGYKEDTVFTQKPIGATGNLTFTRGSDAWRTNVQGLVERTPWNLLQYSEMFTDSYWAKSGSTISANVLSAPNGTLTADKLVENSATSEHLIGAGNYTFSAGAYTISVYAKASERGVLQLLFNGSISIVSFANFDLVNGVVGSKGSNVSESITPVGDGWYRCTLTANVVAGTAPALYYCMQTSTTATRAQTYAGNGTSGIFIWGAQLVEGAYPLEYFPTTDRLNVPRIDYSYGTCPALLLEPQRTNLALQSETFDNASWVKTNASVTANSTTAPDGTTNADTFTANGALSSHELGQSVSVTLGVSYSYSVYAKKNTNNFIQLLGSGAILGVNGWANFNLDTGVVGSVGSAVTASIQNVGNGWYRCTMTAPAVATSSGTIVALLVSSATSPRGEINTLSTSVFIYGAQLEVGAYATSYIKTEATSVTRLADSFSRNNIYTNNLITSAGGTWFVELRNNIVYTRDANTRFGIGDTTALNTNSLFFIGDIGNRINLWKAVSGAVTGLYTTTTDTTKFAFKWNGTSCDIFANGTKVVTATSFTPTNMENLIGALGVPIFIQGMALYPVPLSDVDCELLTNPTSSGYSSFASMASSLGYILI